MVMYNEQSMTKTAVIRLLSAEKPGTSPAEVVAELASKGVVVTLNDVYYARSTLDAKKGKKKIKPAKSKTAITMKAKTKDKHFAMARPALRGYDPSASLATLERLVDVVRQEPGGIKACRAALEIIETIRAMV